MSRVRLPLVALAVALAGCQGVSNLDFGNLYRRAGWQRPERVVEALALEPGDRVADIGAGDGYFVPYLVEAVGPTGTVYAVDVDPERTEALEKLAEERGYSNVVVVLAAYDDPRLPDGEIDVVFLCNTYHHIEERPDYFARLQGDLRAGGEVAVVEPDADLGGVLGLFVREEHQSSAGEVTGEMRQAGYVREAELGFLAIQIFLVFSPEADVQ